MQYYFRIDEIEENVESFSKHDNEGIWEPSIEPGDNVATGGGISGMWWGCDGQTVSQTHLPRRSMLYKACSMYFNGGEGFRVLDGDATRPSRDTAWHPLRFDWDETNYSSYLTAAGQHSTLRTQRADQVWPRMLLPDIYHTQSFTSNSQYGGLKGDLPTFLGLLAFSVHPARLQDILPTLFRDGSWHTYSLEHGRGHRRTLVVYVYCGSMAKSELQQLEEGMFGLYYN
ncbi:hypothetical protein BCR34DRAFT_471842 [Clohesyomyces aquaticus]|uniref:Uncharacterized protein n=1 Tax=Clohesyomyces aquaticus TaxID=1231657 RepID=A0A1Y2AAG7_9PLEO|nr:hypothetical protein BCR34DRAFT_471842 [Clohesyomyces aquaticus]